MRSTMPGDGVVLLLAVTTTLTVGCSRTHGKGAGYGDGSLAAQLDADEPEVAAEEQQLGEPKAGDGAQTVPGGAREGAEPAADFALAAAAFGSQFGPDTPVAVVVALGYAGRGDTWIDESHHYVLLDQRGEPVRLARPRETPSITASPGEYVTVDGGMVHVRPVHRLVERSGVVWVLQDLIGTERRLDPGTYTLVVKATVAAFGPESVITRDDEGLEHKTWAAPDTAKARVHLESSPIRITIK